MKYAAPLFFTWRSQMKIPSYTVRRITPLGGGTPYFNIEGKGLPEPYPSYGTLAHAQHFCDLYNKVAERTATMLREQALLLLSDRQELFDARIEELQDWLGVYEKV